MNHMLWPTALLAVLFCLIGMRAEKAIASPLARTLFMTTAFLLALPGLAIAFYYTKLLHEPIWLYRFRAQPLTELTSSGLGLVAGFLHLLRHKHPTWKKQLRKFTVPAILAVVLSAPYVKPLLRPLGKDQLADRWQDGVCLQSTPSTCGPASAATILRLLGSKVTEAELAHESLTYGGGTENWYLVRALRRRGFEVEYFHAPAEVHDFPCPAIAGVKLPRGTGHFIALLSRDGTNYLAADPMTGPISAGFEQLRSDYKFTGFFIIFK